MINVEQIQKNLSKSGYNPGIIDGIWGRATATALLAYQVSRQPDAMLQALGRACASEFPKADMLSNKYRLAEFLAETSHETGKYTRFEENMHYSAKRLTEVWPSRFKTIQQALPFAWDPTDPDREDVALANSVYGSRMGNEANGTNDNDGWDNRGGGLLQHTGAAEYAALKEIGITPEQVHGGDPLAMVRAALDYWTRKGLNELCDAQKFTLLRQRVNGGTLGLDEIGRNRTRGLAVIA